MMDNKIHDGIISLIGNTPMVKITKLNPYHDEGIEIYAKLEGFNPGGSIKDRIALKMIESAEESGELTKDKTIIEPTSGNTGIGLAMVAAIKGYNVEIVMSAAVSVERRKVLEGFGAKIILSSKDEGTDGAIRLTREMVAKHPEKYFNPDQFNNENNFLAHYETTGVEIVNQVPDLTHFVCALGTTGTIRGNSMRIKEHNENIQVVALEPNIGHKIQGLKNMDEAIKPGIYDTKFFDEKLTVPDRESFDAARDLMKKEGIFVGMSSGSALWGALQIAERLHGEGKKGKIVTIFADRAEKYLSTNLILEDKMSFKIFNTLTRQKQEFVPLEKGKVKMYTCGPTVYNYAHVGNFRSYIFADIFKRHLRYKGYDVKHVMNITDVDDKTIRGSKEKGQTLKEFTEFFTEEFFKDFDGLNILRPEEIPKATETVDEMVDFVEKLLEKGYAYKGEDGSVYFKIEKFEDYGKMAHLDLQNLKAGARICHQEYDKENASDFVLWKAYKEDEDGDVVWDTSLGKGRPGWHLECSAMSMKYLGESIDIHTGGIDLIFPHHQNEVAQSECLTGKTFVNYWVHCNHLMVEGKKMSKSLGNFYTARDIFEKGFSPKALRYLLLSTHYRQQLNLTMDSLKASEQAVERLHEFMLRVKDISTEKENGEGIQMMIDQLDKEFEAHMDDDLNTPQALASVFDFVKKINKLIDEERVSKDYAEKIIAQLEKIDKVLGLLDFIEAEIPEDVINVAEERKAARESKNWAKSDELRDKIAEMGFSILDNKDGSYKIKELKQ